MNQENEELTSSSAPEFVTENETEVTLSEIEGGDEELEEAGRTTPEYDDEDDEEAKDDAAILRLIKSGKWQQRQAEPEQQAQPEEEGDDETDFFLDPKSALEKHGQRVQQEVLAALEPVIRPTAVAQAKASLDVYTDAVGINLDPEIKSEIERLLDETPVGVIQQFANDPRLFGGEIARLRMEKGLHKPKARPVGGSIAGNVTTVAAPAKELVLRGEDKEAWDSWKADFGETPESKAKFLKALRRNK